MASFSISILLMFSRYLGPVISDFGPGISFPKRVFVLCQFHRLDRLFLGADHLLGLVLLSLLPQFSLLGL